MDNGRKLIINWVKEKKMNHLKFNNKIFKKIALVILVIILCNFIVPNISLAATEPSIGGSWIASAGGVILRAVMEFLVFIGDSVINILQNTFLTPEEAIIEAESDVNKNIGSAADWIIVLVGVLVIVVGVVITIASVGTAIGAAGAALAGTAGLVLETIKVIGGTVLTTIKAIGGVLLWGAAGTALVVWGSKGILDDWQREN